jgi:DNA polymerase III delta subunit
MNTPDNRTPGAQAGFHFLAGDDAILRENARADIIAAVRGVHAGAEIVRFSPDDGDFSSFAERIITPSLLSSMRIFLITDVHSFDEQDLDLLTGLYAYDLPDACVVMESDRAPSSRSRKSKEGALSKKFLAWITAFEEKTKSEPHRFSAREFVKPPDYKMAEWVEMQVPRLFGRSISRTNAEYLVDLVGADTSLLNSELRKIDLYLPEKAAIDKSVIDTVAGATRAMTQFELATALGRKDLVRTLEIIESIYAGNVYLPLFVGAIFRQFWAMYKINEFSKVHPDVVKRFKASFKGYNRQQQEETGVAIGVAAGLLSEKQAKSVYPVLVKSGIVDQALSYGAAQYRAIFSMLREYDIGLKTGKADGSKTELQLFCYRIVKGGLL